VGCLARRFPLRRSEDQSSFCESVAEDPEASHGVGRSMESYERRSSRRIGLPTPTWNSLFPTARRVFPDAVPRSLARPGSSSWEQNLSSRVRRCLSPAQHKYWTPSLGFLSPSRQQYAKSTLRRNSHLRLCSALSVSHALDGLLLHTPCGLVSSHCHVRDSHSRGFPRCQAGSPHRRVVPSCRWRVSSPSRLPHRCQIHSLRLQGVDPSSDPLRSTGGLDLPTARSPPVFSTPAGFSPNTLETPSRPLRS
jgi:hypothetical protein